MRYRFHDCLWAEIDQPPSGQKFNQESNQGHSIHSGNAEL